jgi:hypothetical protein
MRDAVVRLSSGRGGGQHPGLLLQRFIAHAADGSERWSAEKRALLSATAGAGIPHVDKETNRVGHGHEEHRFPGGGGSSRPGSTARRVTIPGKGASKKSAL